MNLRSTMSRASMPLALLCLTFLLVSSPALPAEVSETGYPRLMQGPMIGAVTAGCDATQAMARLAGW